MAWRPYEQFVEGELDNTQPGRVTGWLTFVGLPQPVRLELEGDFHRDIRGAKIRVRNPNPTTRFEEACRYMQSFATLQRGSAGDITAGLPPVDYVDYPYIEWYSTENGRVVLELLPSDIEVIGMPIPSQESEPISRGVQERLLLEFLEGLAVAITNSSTSKVTE